MSNLALVFDLVKKKGVDRLCLKNECSRLPAAVNAGTGGTGLSSCEPRVVVIGAYRSPVSMLLSVSCCESTSTCCVGPGCDLPGVR